MAFADYIGLLAKRSQVKIAQWSNGRSYLFQSPHHGVDALVDVARRLPRPGTILDVGANVGQSASRFRAAFPHTRIISIEPVAATFATLQRRTHGLNVECHRLAFGPEAGVAKIYLTDQSLTNSLTPSKDKAILGTEEVEVQTLDGFIDAQGIATIDYLKVDAEGFDLDVIRSGSAALKAGVIRFIQVEVGFHPDDERHPLFDAVRDELAPFGFKVFGIYGQRLEWSGEPQLRFADALFCHSAVS